MNTHQALQNALGGGFFITINMNLLKACEGNWQTAAFLSRAIYWQALAGGEFWKRNEDWKDELMLTAHQLRIAKELLIEKGVLIVTRRGLPSKNYYAVDMEAVAEMIGAVDSQNDNFKREQEIGSQTETELENDQMAQFCQPCEIHKTQEQCAPGSGSVVSQAHDIYINKRYKEKDTVLVKKEKTLKKEKKLAKAIPDTALALAMKFDQHLSRRLPNQHKPLTKPQLENAAKELDRMNRLDGYTYQQIAELMAWSQRDEFWRTAILSTRNLRKHAFRMAIKMEEQNRKRNDFMLDLTQA